VSQGENVMAIKNGQKRKVGAHKGARQVTFAVVIQQQSRPIYYISDVIKWIYDLGAVGRICLVGFGSSLD